MGKKFVKNLNRKVDGVEVEGAENSKLLVVINGWPHIENLKQKYII